jgi:cell division protease FtsH
MAENDPNLRGSNNPFTPKEPAGFNFTYLLFGILIVVWVINFMSESRGIKEIPYSAFISEVSEGRVAKVTLADDILYGEYKSDSKTKPERFVTVHLPDPALLDRLTKQGVVFNAKAKNSFLSSLLIWVLPFFLIYWIWSFVLKRIQDPSRGGLFAMAKSKAKIYMEADVKTTFDDVAGVDEAKDELREVVDFLREPERFRRLGGRSPKGILLVGPPGTGKTLLARAVAGEASVPFFSINGSEFVELFVGLGAARVRDLFEQTRKNAPCILFIDEIDALGKSRIIGAMGGGANDEKEQTLNQLLAEMDGFDASKGVMILAATNRPEILDVALLRAGRFDRQILVGLPDQNGRAQILRVHSKEIKIQENFDFNAIASLTSGFSGADLANLVNEAALVATRRGAERVDEKDFTLAIERIIAGLEQRKKVMSQEEKRRIAAHEMGHALVALSLSKTDRVHKVSIIPRGVGALGYTLQRPTEDRYLLDKTELLHKLAVLLGGRASEIISFGVVSTGAADDLAKATDLARAMVTQYGMAPALGLAAFENPRSPFLKKDIPFVGDHAAFSESTARAIDHEIKLILDSAYEMARGALEKNRRALEEGTRRLLAKETLEENEILGLMQEFKPAALDAS